MATSRMRSAVLLGAAGFLVYGCELFVLGTSQQAPSKIERSQRSSISVIQLWCDELDSASTAAATEVMLHPSGRSLLAVEKHEMADDIARWKRRIRGKSITSYTTDTTSATTHTVDVTFDYIRTIRFFTLSRDDRWFITKVVDR